MSNYKKVFFSDSQHGWLRVKRCEIDGLGIADQITRYSYQKGDWVYLEEDLDVSTFIKAWESRETKKFSVDRQSYCNGSSQIRNFASYRPTQKIQLIFVTG
jgi:hypothetical protein